MTPHLLIMGLGYSGLAIAELALRRGWQVTGTYRNAPAGPDGVAVMPFLQAGVVVPAATHLIITAAPDEAGDPVLTAHAPAIAAAAGLRWIGYLSTTGVYGDRAGGWVDEATVPAPGTPRARRRRAAEQAWEEFGTGRAVDIIRLAGIYGPGRSALDDLRAGTARRIIAPGHLFGRIHVEDIAGAVLAAAETSTWGVRILHGNDDEPAASAEVIEHAAALLGRAPPPAMTLAEAWPGMSPMARSFWAENRKVASRMTQQMLRRRWIYPSYREGLAAIAAAEQGG